MTNLRPYITGLRETLPQAFLLDKRSYAQLLPTLLADLENSHVTGFDIETEDSNRHAGLNHLMKIADAEEGGGNNKLYFDYNRTNITGFSIYCEYSGAVYYVNLGHADIENRLTREQVQPILDELASENRVLLIHNAPFELAHCKKALNWRPTNVLCTMQLAVSAFGPDEYPLEALRGIDVRSRLGKLYPEIVRAFSSYNPEGELTTAQGDLVEKFASKISNASHSYNGIIKDIAYGYGLKNLVHRLFGYQMQTFEETLNGRAHMGQLTGDEVLSYGCDDAYWMIPLFRTLHNYIMQTNPPLWETFLLQENPMIYVYADTTIEGIRLDVKSVEEARELERKNYAQTLREFKAALRPHITLAWLEAPLAPQMEAKEGAWYKKSALKTRASLYRWVHSPDSQDDFTQVTQINGAVADSWLAEKGRKRIKSLSITHYYPVRVLLYDLMPEIKPVISRERKVQSDGETRGVLMERYPENQLLRSIVEALNSLTSIEQRMKLYITPYLNLVDPETHKVYPVLSSRLATRRMAGSAPNFMQLDKQGYVRGFFTPDDERSMIVSIDWSQIELVLLGELSEDPEFLRCYQTVPYEDLHKLATAACLLTTPEILDEIRKLSEPVTEYKGVKLIDEKGNHLTPQKFYKWARKEIGKIANFSYWYSGALSSTASKLDWSADKMWEVVDSYRTQFGTAEAWRQEQRTLIASQGYVELIDHHRRVRLEATPLWYQVMFEHFVRDPKDYADPLRIYGMECLKRIQKRSLNQGVNALIQGGCGALAKRSILKMEKNMSDLRARFMQPIHDELLYNVDRDDVVPFLRRVKDVMCDHPEVIKHVKLDCTAAIGLNFRGFDLQKNPIGQFELDEAPEAPWIPQGLVDSRLDEEHIQITIDNLFMNREALRNEGKRT